MAPRPDPVTPSVVVDRDVLDRNIARMAAHAAVNRLDLRPHAKTHKCAAIAARQLAAGACGLTVATVSEAEFFVDNGCEDVFIAYPVWADRNRATRLRALAERCRLRVGVDSADGAEALARGVAPLTIEVLVEVDSGHHRTGVCPESAADVALAAARAGLRVRGVFTFPGHSYGPGLPRRAASDQAAALGAALIALRAVGLRIDVASGGSTPSAALTVGPPETELRPGVYVFQDAQQVELGTCELADVALSVLATVVSRGPGRVTLNAGGKVLGADRASWSTGNGRLPDQPAARVTALSEHHATVAWPADEAMPSLGDVVRVVPNHVCAAVNLADELVVVAGNQVVDIWPVGARGANT